MTKDAIQEKLTELQQELQQIGNQLLSQSPVACKVIGKIEVYREMLSEETVEIPSDLLRE